MNFNYVRFCLEAIGDTEEEQGFVYVRLSGKYDLTDDISEAKYWKEWGRAEDIGEYLNVRNHIPYVVRPVELCIKPLTKNLKDIPPGLSKALTRLLFESMKQHSNRETRVLIESAAGLETAIDILHGYVEEEETKMTATIKAEELTKAGVYVVGQLGKLIEVEEAEIKVDDNFSIAYKGFHIVGIVHSGLRTSTVEVRDYGNGNPFIMEKRYRYDRGNDMERRLRIIRAKKLIDTFDGERKREKHL